MAWTLKHTEVYRSGRSKDHWPEWPEADVEFKLDVEKGALLLRFSVGDRGGRKNRWGWRKAARSELLLKVGKKDFPKVFRAMLVQASKT